MSAAPHEHWEAIYRRAEYRVLLDTGALSLRVGDYDADGESRLHKATGFQRECAIITACNPGSAITDDALNQRYSETLREQIATGGLRSFATLNIDPSGTWPDEPGFLLVDADHDWVIALGRSLGQNAIVSVRPGLAPSLVWLSPLQDQTGVAGR